MSYLLLKYLHIIAAIFLFGFGMGSYLYLIAATRTRDARLIAAVASTVVRFDNWITTPAGCLQLATGLAMARLTGAELSSGWLIWGLSIFFAVGALWLPVLLLQNRMAALATEASASGNGLCRRFNGLYRCWLWLGAVGFSGMFLVVWIMTTKSAPWLILAQAFPWPFD